jgi:hypothetical protein
MQDHETDAAVHGSPRPVTRSRPGWHSLLGLLFGELPGRRTAEGGGAVLGLGTAVPPVGAMPSQAMPRVPTCCALAAPRTLLCVAQIHRASARGSQASRSGNDVLLTAPQLSRRLLNSRALSRSV